MKATKFTKPSNSHDRRMKKQAPQGHRISVVAIAPLLLLIGLIVVGALQMGQAGSDVTNAPSKISGQPLAGQPGEEAPIMDQQTLEDNIAFKNAAEQESSSSQQAAQSGTPASKDPALFPIQSAWTPEPLKVGITDIIGSRLSGWGSTYNLTNKWRGISGGIDTVVYAGNLKHNNQEGGVQAPTIPEQGLLIVRSWPSGQDPTTDTYESPYRCGPLRIVAEGPTAVANRLIIGGHLLLVSTTMPSWFEFDVDDRQWYSFGIEYQPSLYVPADPPCPLAPTAPPTTPLPPPPPVPTTPPTPHGPDCPLPSCPCMPPTDPKCG